MYTKCFPTQFKKKTKKKEEEEEVAILLALEHNTKK